MTTTNPAPRERVSVLTAEERAGLLALCDRKAKFGFEPVDDMTVVAGRA
jgi:hypothetical protein